MPAYQVTGNEYLSLPAIREDTGAVQGVTVLHMGAKGLLELSGGDGPLIAPVWRINGAERPAALRWRRENAWVPVAQGEAQGVGVTLTYLCPHGRAGAASGTVREKRPSSHPVGAGNQAPPRNRTL